MRFRWTHRLRDYLAARDYYVENGHASILSEIREVELYEDMPKLGKRTLDAATSPPTIDPALPDFETFRQCYSSLVWHFTFKEKPSRVDILTSLVVKPEFLSPEVSLPEMQQNGEKFNVIWLSDTAFVSCMEFSFKVGRTREWPAMDYSIHLWPRTTNEKVRLCVHSLDPSRPAPSIHHLLSKMLLGYPEDYFNLIHLQCHLKDLSALMSFHLLSIIPRKSSSEKAASPVNVRNLTVFHLADNLHAETVQAIMSRGHRKNLPIRYKFRNQRQLGAVLSHCSHLRHVSIEESLIWESMENSSELFAESCCLESASIFYWGHLQSHCLDGIVCNPTVKKLFVLIGFRRGWESFLQQHFTNALSGRVHLNELIVAVGYCGSLESNIIRSGLRTLITTCGVTKSGSLRRLSVVKYPYGYCHWPHVEVQSEPDASDASWDMNMSPGLAMNWYKYECGRCKELSELSKQASEQDRGEYASSASLLPLQVQAVNRGVVYCKTTSHAPHDMSPANATVLFAFLQATLLSCNKV
jgi:hypothetical protein